MQLELDQVLAEYSKGLDDCKEAMTYMIWQYKVCNAFQLRSAIKKVAALQTLAAARTTTVSADLN